MEKHAMDELSRTLASGASRRQLLRLLGGGVAVGAVAATGLGVVEVKGKQRNHKQAHAAQSATSIPISFTSALGSFLGSFAITRFAVQQGQVVAIGTLTGTVKDALGNVVNPPINQALTLPVLPGLSTGTCQILDLVLGPLDLNLLGLVVHLDTVHLKITAQQGGGLLGDLLCSVANLLNGSGNALGRLANLLNQILGAL